MTSYLDQARAEDWMPGHDLERVAIFALERAIAEIEALAKERCWRCRREQPAEYRSPFYDPHYDERFQHNANGNRWVDCKAQPEQRRLAQLREELKKTEGKDAT